MVQVDPRLWPWVVAAVPAPLHYTTLRRHFKRAAAEIGTPELQLHDLRHLPGQMLSEAGLPEAKIKSALRDLTPEMTRRYTRQRDGGEAARAIGVALLRHQVGG